MFYSKFSQIAIADPQKVGDKLNAYVSYKITAEAHEPVGRATSKQTTVIRRFSDFTWLRDVLRRKYPYVFQPPLPEKQQIGRFQKEFIEIRQRALQRWIERVAAHPILGQDEVFLTFVTASAPEYQALRASNRSLVKKNAKAAAQSSGKSILNALKNVSHSVSTAIAQARGQHDPYAVPESHTVPSTAFGELEAYLKAQAPLLSTLYTQSGALALRSREQAQQLLDFAAALDGMGINEGGAVGESLNATATATVSVSTAIFEKAVAETEAVAEKFADYYRAYQSIKKAVNARRKLAEKLGKKVREAETLSAKIRALEKSSEPKVLREKAKASTEFNNLSTEIQTLRNEYDGAVSSVLSEAERYRELLNLDFRSILLDFVNIQIRTEMKVSQAWENITAAAASAAAIESSSAAAYSTQSSSSHAASTDGNVFVA